MLGGGSFQLSRVFNLWQGCHMPLTPDRFSPVSRGQGEDFETGDQGAESSCRRIGSREAAKPRSREVNRARSVFGVLWAVVNGRAADGSPRVRLHGRFFRRG